MRLSEAIEMLARRLGLNRGRTATVANRLQHAGRLPLADAKRTPPELSADDLALLLLAVLAERGVGNAAERAVDYAAMTGDGYRLHDALAHVLRGSAQPGDVIFKEGGVSATINGAHIVFGKPVEDGFARFATGPTLAAIAAEWSGVRPADADAFAAITRIQNGNIRAY